MADRLTATEPRFACDQPGFRELARRAVVEGHRRVVNNYHLYKLRDQGLAKIIYESQTDGPQFTRQLRPQS